MRRYVWLLLGLGAAGLSAAADQKGTVVDFDGRKSTTPAAWKEREPASTMRFMQFQLPKVQGDKDDAELIIFKGIGGSVQDNVKRWKEQFQPPKGKTIDEVSKVTEFKVGNSMLTYLDVQGTYKFKSPPLDPKAKEELKTDYRMLAVHFEGPKNVYHIKLTGPAKTVEHYQKGFDEWLKGFK
jgi:hypothetical protein